MKHRLSLEQVLERVCNLPALPQVVLELDRALQDESASADSIVRLVSRDQGLTTTVLRLANSSFYGVRGRVVSVRDAVHILGLQTLSAAVMTAAVMARFDRAACPRFDFDSCWQHALATALSAQMLAGPRGVDGCLAYTAGLLHDLGTLALASYFPASFDAALAWSAEHDALPVDAERAVLGIDHATVGGLIAQHWRLAPAVVEAIRFHHEVPEGAGNALLDVLHLADNITHALDLTAAADDMVPPLSLSTWERLACSGSELQLMFERIESRLQNLDLKLFH